MFSFFSHPPFFFFFLICIHLRFIITKNFPDFFFNFYKFRSKIAWKLLIFYSRFASQELVWIEQYYRWWTNIYDAQHLTDSIAKFNALQSYTNPPPTQDNFIPTPSLINLKPLFFGHLR